MRLTEQKRTVIFSLVARMLGTFYFKVLELEENLRLSKARVPLGSIKGLRLVI
jgi:hypothetical protein